MRITYHGPQDPNVRDHGVLDVAPVSTAAQAPPCTRLEELSAKRNGLADQVNQLVERVKAGTTDAAEITALATLSGELKQITEDLAVAQQEAKDAAARERAIKFASDRDQLETSLAAARAQREKFATAFRETCLALGEFCASIDEATRLANATAGAAGVLPSDSNRIRDLNRDLHPMPALLDNHEQTKNFGWNLSFAIAPLKRRF